MHTGQPCRHCGHCPNCGQPMPTAAPIIYPTILPWRLTPYTFPNTAIPFVPGDVYVGDPPVSFAPMVTNVSFTN